MPKLTAFYDLRPVDFDSGKRLAATPEMMRQCDRCDTLHAKCFVVQMDDGKSLTVGEKCMGRVMAGWTPSDAEIKAVKDDAKIREMLEAIPVPSVEVEQGRESCDFTIRCAGRDCFISFWGSDRFREKSRIERWLGDFRLSHDVQRRLTAKQIRIATPALRGKVLEAILSHPKLAYRFTH